MSKRICFVAPYVYPYLDPRVEHPLGGAERQQVLLARRLAARGWDVSFIVADFGQPPSTVIEGFELVASYAARSRLPAPLRLPVKYLALWRRLMERKDALFYLRGNPVLAGFLWLARELAGVRYAYAIASDWDLMPHEVGRLGPLQIALLRRALSRAEVVLAQTAFQQRLCRRRFGRKAVLARSLMESPSGPPPGRDRRTIVLWVGRLDGAFKRPLLFLQLARRFPDVPFVMVGNPAGDAALDAAVRADAFDLANFRHLPRVAPDRIAVLYEEAIALVNTSRIEGFPNTYLEAWNAGAPVLSLGVDPDGLIRRHGAGRVCGGLEELGEEIHALLEQPLYFERVSARCLELARSEFGTGADAVERAFAAVGQRLT